MLDRHTSAELSDLQAYEAAFGSLDPVADRRACMIAAQVWNAAGGIPEGDGPNAGRRAAQPEDFLPSISGPPPLGKTAVDATPESDGGADADTSSAADDPYDAKKRSDEMRAAFAAFALPINRKLREQAGRVDAGEPPVNPEAN